MCEGGCVFCALPLSEYETLDASGKRRVRYPTSANKVPYSASTLAPKLLRYLPKHTFLLVVSHIPSFTCNLEGLVFVPRARNC